MASMWILVSFWRWPFSVWNPLRRIFLNTSTFFALHGAGLVDEEHLVELDRLTVVSRETVHKDVHSSFNLKLLACNVNDCVHSTKTC